MIIQPVKQLSTDNLDCDSKDCRVVLLGAGGHAKVLLDTLTCIGVKVEGVLDPVLAKSSVSWRDLLVLGDDDELLKMNPARYLLVNGLGSLPDKKLRHHIFSKSKAMGFCFMDVIHPSCIIGTGVTLGEGVQLMAGTVVQADSSIGDNSIVNTGALIDHDCVIGSDVHIAPGAVLSGGTRVGNGAHIGTGASIIQGVSIGAGAVVGAGTVVVTNIPDQYKLLGQSPKPAIKLDLE